jgi:hypothetical protein
MPILQLTIHSTNYPLCSLVLLQPTIQSTEYPLYCLFRYSNRLCCVLCSTLLCSAIPQPTLACLQPTMLCALLCSAMLCLAILQPTLRSVLPVDITTDYPPLYSACRYCNRLSALLSPVLLHPTIRSAFSGATPTDYPIYRLSAVLSLALLQLTMLCALLYSV